MRALPLVILLLAAACGRASSGDDAPDAAVGEPDADLSPDSEIGDLSQVYAHSGKDLYRIDTENLDVVHIGAFNTATTCPGTPCPSITDIAVDKNDVMIGVSLNDIWSIDIETGAATSLAAFDGGGNLSSLSFVPLDLDDPDSAERLVTVGNAGDVYEVNMTTGATTLLGNFGMSGVDQIRSSGDMVSVRGLGTLATITIGGPPYTALDFLATIDTTTWVATPIGTASTGYDRVFGLGYWGGTIFGFVAGTGNDGTIITIDPTTGVGTPATSSTFQWFGAGVTTNAPIVD
jgi:hypothetical protein